MIVPLMKVLCIMWVKSVINWPQQNTKIMNRAHDSLDVLCNAIACALIAQSVCQRAFSLLEIRFQRPWVRILHSAEEDNLSPFDSTIACLCQTIEINNSTHVYHQRQVRKPTGSGVERAECSLIIVRGYWVQVLSLILDSSVGLSTGIQHVQSAGDSVPKTLGESCIQQRTKMCPLSIRTSLACAWASKLTTINNAIALGSIHEFVI